MIVTVCALPGPAFTPTAELSWRLCGAVAVSVSVIEEELLGQALIHLAIEIIVNSIAELFAWGELAGETQARAKVAVVGLGAAPLGIAALAL